MSKKYKVGDVVDLDDVNISPASFAAWHTIAQRVVQALALVAKGPIDIPDEQGLWLATGELEIFVEIQLGQTTSRIAMKIPPGQWTWADPNKKN